MPAWLLSLLLKVVLPLIISWLQKEGYVNAAEALVARGVDALAADLKIQRKYPDDPAPPTGPTNMTTTGGIPVGLENANMVFMLFPF